MKRMAYKAFTLRADNNDGDELRFEILIPQPRISEDGNFTYRTLFRIFVNGESVFQIAGFCAEDLLAEFYDIINHPAILELL